MTKKPELADLPKIPALSEVLFNGTSFPGTVSFRTTTSNTYEYREPKFARGHVSLMGLSIELEDVSWDDRQLRARVRVPDRDTGAPLPLNFSVNFDACHTEEEMAEAIVKSLANVIAHEIAEMVFIRGERFDPHKRPPFFQQQAASPALIRGRIKFVGDDDV